MATNYTAGPGTNTSSIRAVSSRYRGAPISRNGLVISGIFHAESLTEKKRIHPLFTDRVISIERPNTNRMGFSTPEAPIGLAE